MPQTKIATCCYCGTRAALVLNQAKHELVCSSCGAPLHNMKALRNDAVDAAQHSAPRKGKKGKTRHEGHHGGPAGSQRGKGHPDRRRKKPRKSMAERIFSEVFDVIEELLD